MPRIPRPVSASVLLVGILVCGSYAIGKQGAKPPRAVSPSKATTSQSGRGPSDKVADQLAQVQEQLKRLQDTVEAMQSEQHLMNLSVDSAARLSARNSLDLAEVIHTLTENRKVIDLVDGQLQVANNWGDHNATGVGILLGRTNNLESDLRQIKTRLGLY